MVFFPFCRYVCSDRAVIPNAPHIDFLSLDREVSKMGKNNLQAGKTTKKSVHIGPYQCVIYHTHAAKKRFRGSVAMDCMFDIDVIGQRMKS